MKVGLFASVFVVFLLCVGSVHALTYVDSCRTLPTYGETYELNATINYTGGDSCLQALNSSITIDCAGYSVINSGSGSSGVLCEGFTYDCEDDFVVKNCDLQDWNIGVYLFHTNNSLVYNNTGSGLNIGINAEGNLTVGNITKNTITGFTNEGFDIEYADNFTLEDNYATSGTGGDYCYTISSSRYIDMTNNYCDGNGTTSLSMRIWDISDVNVTYPSEDVNVRDFIGYCPTLSSGCVEVVESNNVHFNNVSLTSYSTGGIGMYFFDNVNDTSINNSYIETSRDGELITIQTYLSDFVIENTDFNVKGGTIIDNNAYLGLHNLTIKNCEVNSTGNEFYQDDSCADNRNYEFRDITITMNESSAFGFSVCSLNSLIADNLVFHGVAKDLWLDGIGTTSITNIIADGVINCDNCDNVYIYNVTSSNSPEAGMYISDGENATLDLINIYNTTQEAMLFRDYHNLTLTNIDINKTGTVGSPYAGIHFFGNISSVYADNVEISDTTQNAIQVESNNGINDSVFDHFYIYDSYSNSMNIGNPQNLTLQNFIIRDSTTGDGLYVFSTGYQNDLKIQNATIENVAGQGIYITANNNRDNVEIYDVVIDNAVDYGIHLIRQNNIAVDNVNMTQIGGGFNSGGDYATNGNFTNIMISGHSGTVRGLNFDDGSHNNNFENITINLTGISSGEGVRYYCSGSGCENVSFVNLKIYDPDDEAFELRGVNNVTFRDIETYDAYYGIYLYQVNDVTVDNLITNDNDIYGIYYRDVINSSLKNIVTLDNAYYGVYTRDSDNISLEDFITNNNGAYGMRIGGDNYNIDNVTINGSGSYGIYYSGDNGTISNAFINNSNLRGFYVSGSAYNVFENITSHNNNMDDIYVYPSNEEDCNNLLINVRGTGNLPFLFYNDSVTVQNRNDDYNSIVLCNADNSVFENITSTNNKGHYRVYLTQNATITNHRVSNGYSGIIMGLTGSSVTLNGGIYQNVSSGLYNFGNVINARDVYVNDVNYISYNGTTGGYAYYVRDGNLTCDNCSVYNPDLYGVWILDGDGDTTYVTFNNSYFEGGNETVYADDSYGDSLIEFYNSNINGSIKSECADYDPPSDVCAYDNTINLYDSTVSSYNITNSTLDVYWSLQFSNPDGAQIEVYDVEAVKVYDFTDTSKTLWLREFYVTPPNVRTNSTPHDFYGSKPYYESAYVALLMSSSGSYIMDLMGRSLELPLVEAGHGLGGFLTAITDPTVDLVLALGFIGGILMVVFGLAFAVKTALRGREST